MKILCYSFSFLCVHKTFKPNATAQDSLSINCEKFLMNHLPYIYHCSFHNRFLQKFVFRRNVMMSYFKLFYLRKSLQIQNWSSAVHAIQKRKRRINDYTDSALLVRFYLLTNSFIDVLSYFLNSSMHYFRNISVV